MSLPFIYSIYNPFYLSFKPIYCSNQDCCSPNLDDKIFVGLYRTVILALYVYTYDLNLSTVYSSLGWFLTWTYVRFAHYSSSSFLRNCFLGLICVLWGIWKFYTDLEYFNFVSFELSCSFSDFLFNYSSTFFLKYLVFYFIRFCNPSIVPFNSFLHFLSVNVATFPWIFYNFSEHFSSLLYY